MTDLATVMATAGVATTALAGAALAAQGEWLDAALAALRAAG